VPRSRRSTRSSEMWWQLRIELLDVSPRIWRRILVPDTIALPKLDTVIQEAVGWTNSHLHEFVICGVRYGVPDPDFARELGHVDEKGVRLGEALGQKSRCFDYVYDFGDDWHHVVMVEDQHTHAAEKIRCTDGENAGPPEDVGGAHGYQAFLNAIADPTHAEHRSFLDWVGGSFDATQFDITAVNRALAEITPR
jgi:hypothetical protein